MARGWTIQELPAPQSVEFFSQERRLLGDKRSPIRHIHATTGIPHEALQHAPLSQFNVNQRISWIKHCQASFEEDRAFLPGIFGIYVTPVYGEGTASEFKRH